ncbi:TrwC relaxase [Modestobacter sp. Leaf380]|nr:TrwC relaxase [Modestobacter sp. Leaf380]
MMTVHKLTAGSGYTYLTRQVAAHDATDQPAGGLGAYYSEKGEAPGRWMGRGLAGRSDFPVGDAVTEAQMVALFGHGRHPNAAQIEQAARAGGRDAQEIDRASRLGRPFGVFGASNDFRERCAVEFRELNQALGLPAASPVSDDERARIHTEVAGAMFEERFGRPALDARELSGHLARISRQPTTAVAGYDLTFSPVKSVSTLWAIAPHDVAAVIERAHQDAVEDAVSWLESHATYTRTGRGGVAQVDVRGLIAASFTHRDSRAGDPDLHTHVAISNKVQTLDDRWLALDGRAVYKNNVAASERYNTRVEALLTDRLRVRFADRPAIDPGKRPVREIVGVDGPLPRFWSSRRSDIDARRAVLAAQFQADHGRPPSAKESVGLAQQANLETRSAKHEPRSHAEQRTAWRAEARTVLGSDDEIRAYVASALHAPPGPGPGRPTGAWVAATADLVVSVMEGNRSTWQEPHVRAETERQLRAAGIPLAELDRAGEAVVAAALSPQRSLRLQDGARESVPGSLRRTDGSSVFDVAGAEAYTSRRMLADEATVLLAAERRDGRVTPAAAVMAAVSTAAADGTVLNTGQQQLVRELATSGARVQLALAPAGTGKTTALSMLAAAWTAGGGSVVGLAPSASASAVLREHLGSQTDTLAKLVHAVTTGVDVPAWVESIGPSTLVVLDEAAMAPTRDLARLVDFVVGAGGSIRLIGDDHQLGPIGAGGLLRELAHTQGAARLTQVVRFIDPVTGAPNQAEGAASLALRDGDPAALAFYVDNGRLHVGEGSTVVDGAFAAWATDLTAGHDAVLLAPTRQLVLELNTKARTERIARQGSSGLEVDLPDSSRASAGDVVITRRNDRLLAAGQGDWVKNGDRWTVTGVRAGGDLDVVHRRTGKHVTLPAGYVQAHVTLGYATTVHGAQGITADRCHAIATGAESRQLLYVAMTRGRHENHVFLSTIGDGDPHSLVTRDALLPPTAVDVLRRVLARDDAPTSATGLRRAQDDPATCLHVAVGQYQHALATAAQHVVGPELLSKIDEAAEQDVHGLTDEDSYPTLRGHLALSAVSGVDPVELLRRAIDDPRGLGDARDIAAVLDWRLGPSGDRSPHAGPLPWLPALPDALRHDAEWGHYLTGRSQEVSRLAVRVSDEAAAWTAADAPAWAQPLVDHDASLLADTAVWRAAHGIPDDERRPTGPPLPLAAEAASQRDLDDRRSRLLGRPGTATERWRSMADGLEPRLCDDPYWPLLCERMSTAEGAGIDVTSLVRSACARPLPDEQPAAALWWRLADHLSPAALAADGATAPASPSSASAGDDEIPPSPTAPGDAAPRPEPAGPVAGPTPAEPGTHGRLPADRVRLLELNRLAADYFAAAYPCSWARSYLADRLGTDLVDDARFIVGHAPGGWNRLVVHLRTAGASDDELLAAGLASRASTGQLIDRFRDRLVFAIQGDDGIHGWIGRRNPADDGGSHTAPKYLNTADTELFTKGHELFGLIEGSTQLRRGATAVLVEGPMDALAVNLAGAGRFVGVAPMGTAFTATQAARLNAVVGAGGQDIVVGTDDDRAGHLAAERIYWQLADSGGDPRRLVLPCGMDPADLLRTQGPSALRDALSDAPSLAATMIEARIDVLVDRLDTVEGRVHATRRAAEVIASTVRTTWAEHLTHVVARTGIAPDIALSEVLAAADQRTPGSTVARGGTGPTSIAAGSGHRVTRPVTPAPVLRPSTKGRQEELDRAATLTRRAARSTAGGGHGR